jgi:hypothetical protein
MACSEMRWPPCTSPRHLLVNVAFAAGIGNYLSA